MLLVQLPMIWLLSHVIWHPIAIIIAYLVGGQLGFVLNSLYTWDDKHPNMFDNGLHQRWREYTIVNAAASLVNMGAQLLIVYGMQPETFLERWLMVLPANGVSFMFTFWINHTVVFRHRPPKELRREE